MRQRLKARIPDLEVNAAGSIQEALQIVTFAFLGIELVGVTAGHPELEGDFDQRPSWLSPDGCRLYVTRRDPDTGLDLWVAERSP